MPSSYPAPPAPILLRLYSASASRPCSGSRRRLDQRAVVIKGRRCRMSSAPTRHRLDQQRVRLVQFPLRQEHLAEDSDCDLTIVFWWSLPLTP